MDRITRIILSNMMENGSIKEDDNYMNSFITMNRDYNIDLIRAAANLWRNTSSYSYLCRLVFRNSINQTILEIITNEIEIDNFLQYIYYQLEFNSLESIFNIGNLTLTLKRDLNYSDLYSLYIGQYSSTHQIIVNRIKIDFSYESLIEFLNTIYFTFLSDLDTSYHSNPDFLF